MSDNIIDFKKTKKEVPKPNKPSQPPLINLPFATKMILIALVLIYAFMGVILDENDRSFLILNLGFIPSIWTGESPYGFDIYALISPISYIFLHGNMMHLIMNSTMLMAFGAGVEKWMGAKKYILFGAVPVNCH